MSDESDRQFAFRRGFLVGRDEYVVYAAEEDAENATLWIHKDLPGLIDGLHFVHAQQLRAPLRWRRRRLLRVEPLIAKFFICRSLWRWLGEAA